MPPRIAGDPFLRRAELAQAEECVIIIMCSLLLLFVNACIRQYASSTIKQFPEQEHLEMGKAHSADKLRFISFYQRQKIFYIQANKQ